MAKDLEQRFDAAMKKGEKQDLAKQYRKASTAERSKIDKNVAKNTDPKGYAKDIYKSRMAKRSTSDGYMPEKKVNWKAVARANKGGQGHLYGAFKKKLSE